MIFSIEGYSGNADGHDGHDGLNGILMGQPSNIIKRWDSPKNRRPILTVKGRGIATGDGYFSSFRTYSTPSKDRKKT